MYPVPKELGKPQETLWAKIFIGLLVVYSLIFILLLITHFKNESNFRATLMMSLGLFLVWICLGGFLQRRHLKNNYTELTTPRIHPISSFVYFAITLALIEEAIATSMTNLATLFGGTIGQSFITASTNYFHVIFFHSVIVFIPMLFMLGYILKKYDISPFKAAVLFGCVGVVGEFTLSGPMVFINTPFWILVYGLMVYLPAHLFVNTQRKKPFFLLYPLFVIVVAFSAVSTFWLPALVDKDPSKHFTK